MPTTDATTTRTLALAAKEQPDDGKSPRLVIVTFVAGAKDAAAWSTKDLSAAREVGRLFAELLAP